MTPNPARPTFAIAAATAARLAALLACAAPLRAGTIDVPASAPTIQAAIVLAGDGDTILVAPGTYAEAIDFLGKRLAIEGTGGAAVTILDGGGAGSVVTADSFEPAGTLLRGFTVTGGAGHAVTTSIGIVFGGSGVLAGTGATLELRDCLIAGNTASSTLPTEGAGVLVNVATVSLVGCTLSGNVAGKGAAVGTSGFNATVSLTGCTISGNTAGPQDFDAVLDLAGSVSAVEGCFIVDNDGTGLVPGDGTLTACVFKGNSRWGLHAAPAGGTTLAHCEFLGNGLGGAHLGVPATLGAGHAIDHCVFAKADVLRAEANLGLVTVTNCSFDGAHADVFFGNAVARNCIFWNTPKTIAGSPGSVSITYCDFPDSGAGPGDIDADPLWVNPAAQDYHLQENSPCIDAGDPASPLDADGSPADMGALPFVHAWVKLGGGVAGINGLPELAGTGTLVGGTAASLMLSHAPAFQPTAIILGAAELGVPFKSGTFWPALHFVFIGLTTDSFGTLVLPDTWPVGLPSGFKLWVQFWFPDSTAPDGYSGSNGVVGTTP